MSTLRVHAPAPFYAGAPVSARPGVRVHAPIRRPCARVYP